MRVYVASTYIELEHYRQAAERVIRALGHEPEMLNALDGLSDDEVVIELSLRVGSCDCEVVIVGSGRGSIPKVSGLVGSSFIEVEYRAARLHNLARLVFHVQSEAKSQGVISLPRANCQVAQSLVYFARERKRVREEDGRVKTWTSIR